jgi:hypothetical protein
VTLYVSEDDASLDGATQVAQFRKTLKLKAGASKLLPARITQFPSLPDGAYHLLASVQAGAGDETGVAGPALSIAAPFVKIAASDLRPLGAAASPDKAARFTVTLDDTGNMPAAGVVTLNLTGSPIAGGGGSQPLGSATLKVKLKANQTRTFRTKLTLPATLPAGTYTLAGLIDLSPLGDNDPADDNVAGTAALTVR